MFSSLALLCKRVCSVLQAANCAFPSFHFSLIFHTHRHFLIFFSLSLFSCYLASIFTLSLALSLPSLSVSLLIFLPPVPLTTTFFGAAAFYIFALLVPFLCLVAHWVLTTEKVLYFAVHYSQHIVYLDFGSLILLSSTTIEDSTKH